jgi:hypothetical protein
MAFDETYEADGFKWGVIETDGAQTNTVLIAAPGAGKFIQILRAYVSSSAINEIRLEDEDDNLVVGWVLIAGGVGHFEIPVAVSGAGGVKLPENKALEMDSSGGGAAFMSVLYRIVSS